MPPTASPYGGTLLNSVAVTVRAEVLRHCQSALEGWRDLTLDDVDMDDPKGFSSFTMAVRPRPRVDPPAVFYRRLSDKENAILDHAAERAVFLALSEAGVAARCYHYERAFRIEALYSGRALTAADLREPDILRGIGRKLARLHALTPPPLPADDFWTMLHLRVAPLARRTLIDRRAELPAHEQPMCEALLPILEPETAARVRAFLPPDEPVGFSHCDTYHGNVFLTDDGEVHLLDFEFSCRNVRAFDFSNLFAETVMIHGLADYPHFDIGPPPYTSDHVATLVEAYVEAAGRPAAGVDRLVAQTLRLIPLSDYMFSMAALPLALEPVQKIRFVPYAVRRFERFLATELPAR